MISTIQRVNDLARSAEPTRLPSILVSELPTQLGRHHNAFNCVWGVVVWGVTPPKVAATRGCFPFDGAIVIGLLPGGRHNLQWELQF